MRVAAYLISLQRPLHDLQGPTHCPASAPAQPWDSLLTQSDSRGDSVSGMAEGAQGNVHAVKALKQLLETPKANAWQC